MYSDRQNRHGDAHVDEQGEGVHHGGDQKEINEIIIGHDFKKFYDISEEIEENSPYLCYFPETACVVSKDEYIGDLNIFRSEETFSCITWSECECG